MTYFKYEFGRVTGKECPLFPGQYALKIIETKKGKTFSEIIHILTEQLTDPDVLGVMNTQYILYMEVQHPMDEETFGDIKLGLQEFDKTSFELRDAAAKTEEARFKESRKRTYAYLHMKGIFDAEHFAISFDAVHLDLSKITEEVLKNNIIYLVAIGNRTSPTTFTISKELADKLLDEDFSKTQLATYLKNKSIISKNVFAAGTTASPLLNKNIRLLP